MDRTFVVLTIMCTFVSHGIIVITSSLSDIVSCSYKSFTLKIKPWRRKGEMSTPSTEISAGNLK